METLRGDFESAGDSNIIAISTGFDRHENDRGVNHAACTLAPSGASHTPLLEMHADFTTDLLAGLWSGGTRSISEPHPLGNNSEFHPALRKSLRLGLRLARTDLQ